MKRFWLVSSSAVLYHSQCCLHHLWLHMALEYLSSHVMVGWGCPCSTLQAMLIPAKPGCGCCMPTLPALPCPALLPVGEPAQAQY